MSRTITALFDNRSDAEAARDQLCSGATGVSDVHLSDQSSPGYRQSGYSTHEDRGIWESIKNAFLPDEDRYAYEEGIRRGGTLLVADVDDRSVNEATQILERTNSIDLDERSNQWRSQGWDYSQETARGRDDAAIPIVEEQLVVGKREVDRGGARLRSYVTETPVHEQVRLRNERVEVERRPVDQPVAAGDKAFQERTVEMTARGEEAVIGKEARVVEEVRLHKTADEEVQEIDETVRKTEVEVDGDIAGGDLRRR